MNEETQQDEEEEKEAGFVREVSHMSEQEGDTDKRTTKNMKRKDDEEPGFSDSQGRKDFKEDGTSEDDEDN